MRTRLDRRHSRHLETEPRRDARHRTVVSVLPSARRRLGRLLYRLIPALLMVVDLRDVPTRRGRFAVPAR
jgi:hypothetical protein